MAGYVSNARYRVEVSDRRDRTTITLVRTRLTSPHRKRFPRPADELARYRRVVRMGWSVGAYDGTDLVGIALAEPRAWNRSVWVWELGVAPDHRRQGIATGLIRELGRKARRSGYRVIICETQTTNAPAIAFYRRAGFRLEAVDLSYYSNEDVRKGEVAIFMKKRLASKRRPAKRRRRRPAEHTSE